MVNTNTRDRFGLRQVSVPGFWEGLRQLWPGSHRMLDCLQVEVTSRCAARCTYCPHTLLAERWQSLDMTPQTFGRLWPLLRQSGRVHLQGWGEPLLHSLFFEMVALARDAGCAVSTTTCGLCMSSSVAEQLVASGVDIVAFSLVGTDGHSNAPRRGVDFDRVCAAIEQLQEVRRARQGVHLEIHIAYLLLASALEAVRRLPALMQRLGVHAAVISTLDYLPSPSLASEAFAPEEHAKLAAAERVLSETAAEARQRGQGFHWSLPRSDGAGNGCRENIARTLFVAVDGSLSPCVYTHLPLAGPDPDRRSFGNVMHTDPLSIWQSEAFRTFRKGLACGRPDQRCHTCVKRLQH